jgi:hypothetical protein
VCMCVLTWWYGSVGVWRYGSVDEEINAPPIFPLVIYEVADRRKFV